MKEVFHLPIDKNGIYSAAPFLGILLSKILCLKLSNLLINMNVMSLTNVRKFFQSICLFTPTICLIILTFKNDDKNLDIFLITFAMFGQGKLYQSFANRSQIAIYNLIHIQFFSFLKVWFVGVIAQ